MGQYFFKFLLLNLGLENHILRLTALVKSITVIKIETIIYYCFFFFFLFHFIYQYIFVIIFIVFCLYLWKIFCESLLHFWQCCNLMSRMVMFVVLTRTSGYVSRIVRKREFGLCENKGADQLRSNCEADQRLSFRYPDSIIPLLLKSEISSI